MNASATDLTLKKTLLFASPFEEIKNNDVTDGAVALL